MKRMLEVKENRIYINSSSLSLIQTCMRKTKYRIERNIVGGSESPALLFGTAVHKALEKYYLEDTKEEETLVLGFTEHAEPLKEIEKSDKHSIENGIELMKIYHETYKDDPWVIYKDYVEKEFEYYAFTFLGYEVYIFGTIDAIMKNTLTFELAAWDHKTAARIDSSFAKKVRPNDQYTTYIAGANAAFDLNIDSLYQNGIQKKNVFGKTGKRLTEPELCRIKTSRDTDDINELYDSIRDSVRRYVKASETDTWPMSPGLNCHVFNGCQYHGICSSPKSMRENVIKHTGG